MESSAAAVLTSRECFRGCPELGNCRVAPRRHDGVARGWVVHLTCTRTQSREGSRRSQFRRCEVPGKQDYLPVDRRTLGIRRVLPSELVARKERRHTPTLQPE